MARKDEILDALIEIFKNQGIGSDFTMSQLAAKVNIGKSTIYEYFKTKDEVLQSAILRIIEQAVDGIYTRDIDKHQNFEITFKEELKFLFTMALDSRFMFNLVTPNFKRAIPDSMRDDVMTRMKNVSRHYEQRFQDIFMKGIEEGVIKQDNMVVNGMLISSLVSGSIMRLANANLEAPINIDVEEYANAIYQASIKITN